MCTKLCKAVRLLAVATVTISYMAHCRALYTVTYTQFMYFTFCLKQRWDQLFRVIARLEDLHVFFLYLGTIIFLLRSTFE